MIWLVFKQLTKGCHSYSFCATVVKTKVNGQLKNICHSQRSSHYISLIFAVKLIKVKGISALKPRIVILMINFFGQDRSRYFDRAVADHSTGVMIVIPP